MSVASVEKLQARKRHAGQVTADKLLAAHAALCKFISACRDVGEGPKAIDDGRLLLAEQMAEYAGYLRSVFPKD